MRNFDIESVATRSTDEVEEFAHYTRLIRNRRKLAAIVHNACQIIDLDGEHTGFANYLRSGGSYELTIKYLRKQFKLMGEISCYYFLYVVGENVPSYEGWLKSREAQHRR